MNSPLPVLLNYMVAQGLIARGALVDGGVSASMGRSRNRFAAVQQRSGPGYFVKQSLGEPLAQATLRREAALYRMAGEDARLVPLKALLPPLHHFDSEKGMLITGLIRNADNLAFLHNRLRAFPVTLAATLGQALAGLQRIPVGFADGAEGVFERAVPWIFHLHRGHDIAHWRRSSAASAVLDMMLAAPALAGHFDQLYSSWRRDALVHTDMRWENCLFGPRTLPLEQRQLFVIDWELVDIGDASWDVGGLLQSYITTWIGSIPAGAAPADRVGEALYPLAAIRPATAAFWQAFRAHGGGTDDPAAFLERSVRMMAARMMVTAFEISLRAEELDPRVVSIVRCALEILERPAEAARDLLGIDPDDRGSREAEAPVLAACA